MPIWVTILIAVLGSGGFFTFLQYLINRRDATRKQESEDIAFVRTAIEEARTYDMQMAEKLMDINSQLIKQESALHKSEVAHQSEIRTLFLLRADQIIQKGFITEAEFSEIETLYHEYHDIWGLNGFGTKKYEMVINLPITE